MSLPCAEANGWRQLFCSMKTFRKAMALCWLPMKEAIGVQGQ